MLRQRPSDHASHSPGSIDAEASSLVLSRPLSYTFASVLIAPLLLRLYLLILAAYTFFLSLVPGGTPQTPSGYLKICLLRLIARSKADVLRAPQTLFASPYRPSFKSAEDLPCRPHARPRVAGLAPQRQINQLVSQEDVDALHKVLRDLAASNPTSLQTGKSCFEKHSLALFLTPFSNADKCLVDKAFKSMNPDSATRNATCGAPPEVAHMHGSDGSLHLTLHPSDAGLIIEKGWGERHPLAGRTLPGGFCLVYAPRGKQELETVGKIVSAAAWWVGSVKMDRKGH